MSDPQTVVTQLREVDGFLGSCLVDGGSGMMVAFAEGRDGFDIETAAAGSTEIVRAAQEAVQLQGGRETTEDILITLSSQYHLIRRVARSDGLFLLLALRKADSNLAMARHVLSTAEGSLAL